MIWLETFSLICYLGGEKQVDLWDSLENMPFHVFLHLYTHSLYSSLFAALRSLLWASSVKWDPFLWFL